MRAIAALVIWLVAGFLPAGAQEFSALARLLPAESRIAAPDADSGGPLTLDLAISQPVPWRVRLLDAPPRLVLDTREVDWRGIDALATGLPPPLALRAGSFRPGWSRLVMELPGPMTVTRAGMTTGTAQPGGPGATIGLRLDPALPEAFRAEAARPEPPQWALPEPVSLPAAPLRGAGPLVVMLDPGHGGIDPGAENGSRKEAALVLAFARELKELLLRDGRFRVAMTREEDVFVPLETRISLARRAGARVLLSLHADALSEGEAQGATVYTLAEAASDAAAQALAERHDRDDLLAGVDLSQQDDVVAAVLMDMARAETAPRTDRLATALVTAIRAAGLRMHRHPRQEAAFSVLKAPDIPSVLLELGFLSSTRDLTRLEDAEWRAAMAEAIRQALHAWADEDQLLRNLRDD